MTHTAYKSKQYSYMGSTLQQLASAKILEKHSLCPMHRSDKISTAGPDILLDLLRALFLPSKIGRFNKSEKNVHSFVNTDLVFFVCITNTVLNILTVLLDEVWNVELLFRSVKWVLSTKALCC